VQYCGLLTHFKVSTRRRGATGTRPPGHGRATDDGRPPPRGSQGVGPVTTSGAWGADMTQTNGEGWGGPSISGFPARGGPMGWGVIFHLFLGQSFLRARQNKAPPPLPTTNTHSSVMSPGLHKDSRCQPCYPKRDGFLWGTLGLLGSNSLAGHPTGSWSRGPVIPTNLRRGWIRAWPERK